MTRLQGGKLSRNQEIQKKILTMSCSFMMEFIIVLFLSSALWNFSSAISSSFLNSSFSASLD